MLKRRIIPLLLWRNGRLVKTKKFDEGRVVGDPVKTARVYSDQDADEICLLNISSSSGAAASFTEAVRQIAMETLAPLAVGGDIRTMKDAETAFRAGADKIVVNSLCYLEPRTVKSMVEVFGSQAIVGGIDFTSTGSNILLRSEGGRQLEQAELTEHLQSLEDIGVGEILLQSIDRDGTASGYDLETLRVTLARAKTPVICAGGAGNYGDLLDAFQLGVDAVACGTLFNFGDNNPIRAKAFLRNYDIALKKSI